jgi:hypothetical protein
LRERNKKKEAGQPFAPRVIPAPPRAPAAQQYTVRESWATRETDAKPLFQYHPLFFFFFFSFSLSLSKTRIRKEREREKSE